jgi:hypothetical protein
MCSLAVCRSTSVASLHEPVIHCVARKAAHGQSWIRSRLEGKKRKEALNAHHGHFLRRTSWKRSFEGGKVVQSPLEVCTLD